MWEIFKPVTDKSIFFAIFILIQLILTGCEDPSSVEVIEKPFAGEYIMVIAPKLRAGLISGPIIDEAQVFGEQSGANIRVVTPGWNETIEQIQKSFSDPKLHYDVFVITTSWSGPLFAESVIAEIPDWVKEEIDFEDILPIYVEDALSWNGKIHALPYDGDTVTLYYRKDLFENPEYKRQFHNQYGYTLLPPKTWDEFHDIANFFNDWDWNEDGRNEYGMVGSRMKNSSAMLIFLTRAAAFAKHPNDRAYHFDPDTMKPRINNPAFIKALQEYVDSLKYGPPGMVNFTGSEVRRAFIEGRAAMAIDWANIGIDAASSPISNIKGKVGYAVLPGSTRVFNAMTLKWEERLNQPASMVGNYLFLINKNSKHLKLAMAFTAHMTSKEMTGKLTTTAGTGVNPSRKSHLNLPEAWTSHGMSAESAKAYLDTLKLALMNNNYIFDIRIPGSSEYYKALDLAIYDALNGQLTPKQALDRVASEWNSITDKHGREKQITLYKDSLSLN